MDFQCFLKYVPDLVQARLPAATAHAIMAPALRLEHVQEHIPHTQPKKAAVMLLLYPKEQVTHLVLIVRNTYPGVHSAQVAFPGGKYELADKILANTALRETQEEVGVPLEKMQILRPFTPLYIPASNFMVHPYLGICTEQIGFVPDPTEVASILELPLSVFMSDALLTQTTRVTSYANEVVVPAFAIKDQLVWGATAMMWSELKEVLKSVLNKPL
ncbi:NUDIX hydrolase [Flavobacterium crassostreae]|uniref:NUDIX hydrolase n=1 Tax=Flavobacterium crassostreae TaxID=1763534 RepID=UPI0008A51A84|nr:CoA pyrophosphatase [Flavobacterium crassostreae]